MKLRIVDRIAQVAASDWNACAGAANPFVSHAFLNALEQSSSVGRAAGWLPQHLLLEDDDRRLVAAAPLYVKSHSQGEYVFDHGWAEAWLRAGGRYYPKLQVSVPFTPVPGPRLLVRPGEPAHEMKLALANSLRQIVADSGFSSVHVTFAESSDIAALRDSDFLIRSSLQYHWANRDYEDFDEFLAALSARKRKAIRKERDSIARSGLTIRRYVGAELDASHWDAFYSFYMDTGGRKWGRPYLNREFFAAIGETMADRILLVMAERDGRPIAGALNFVGQDALFGRNWGCIEDYKFLHFELCYYQAIEFAIESGLARVEAGAQGEHKIQRGYLPTPTPSAHWIAHEGFRAAVAEFVERESRAMAREYASLMEFSPYRRKAS